MAKRRKKKRRKDKAAAEQMPINDQNTGSETDGAIRVKHADNPVNRFPPSGAETDGMDAYLALLHPGAPDQLPPLSEEGRRIALGVAGLERIEEIRRM